MAEPVADTDARSGTAGTTAPEGGHAVLRVRYFAGAAAAAGVEEEDVVVPLPARVADVSAALGVRHPRLVPVLEVATLLVDEVSADADQQLAGDAAVDVLPPFAGG